MFNRRFYRVKIFQQLYAYHQDPTGNITLHQKNMLKSLDKTHELYIFLLSFAAELHQYVGKELEIQRNKFIANEEASMQLDALFNNKLLSTIASAHTINDLTKFYQINWSGTTDFFKQVIAAVKQFGPFLKYCTSPNRSFEGDSIFISHLMQYFLVDCEIVDSFIEERYIAWEDDQTIVTAAIIKTFSRMKENDGATGIINNTEDKEGRDYMLELFAKTISEDEMLTNLIADKTKNWDKDRIAVTDMILMKMCLCELLHFPHVPVKVSINEYLEIAKLYSTRQSHSFINGVLDKIQLDLKKENKIVKLGRGLVE
jgi:N utilization substance protein B